MANKDTKPRPVVTEANKGGRGSLGDLDDLNELDSHEENDNSLFRYQIFQLTETTTTAYEKCGKNNEKERAFLQDRPKTGKECIRSFLRVC